MPNIIDRLLNREQEELKSKVDDKVSKKANKRSPAKPKKRQRDERGRFVPGWDGGPGRPPGKSWKSIFNHILDCLDPDLDVSYRELVAHAIIGSALGGSVGHANIVLDRTEGKVPQRQELTGREGGPIAIAELSDDERRRRVLALFGLGAEEGAGQPADDGPAIQEDVLE